MKGILKDKLENMELPVPEHLWANVSSQINHATTATTSGTATVSVWSKVAIWVIAAASCTGIAIWVVNASAEPVANTTKPTVEQIPQSPSSDNETSAIPSEQTTLPKLESVAKTTNDARTEPVQANIGPDNQTKTIIDVPQDGVPSFQPPVADASTTPPATEPQLQTESWRSDITELPAASALFEILPTEGATFEFKAKDTNNTAKFQWNFGDGNTASGPLATHTYRQAGEFAIVLTCTDMNGKQVSSQQTIEVKGHGNIEVANVITPNGDGENDVFDPSALAPLAEIDYLMIMSFDGRKIFESTSNTIWNGKLENGDYAPAGSYLYLIRGRDKNSGIIEKSARLTVIR